MELVRAPLDCTRTHLCELLEEFTGSPTTSPRNDTSESS